MKIERVDVKHKARFRGMVKDYWRELFGPAKRDVISEDSYKIIEIDESHQGWERFLEVVASLGIVETGRITLEAEHFLSSHILAAMAKEKPLGYLRFVVQRLGEDEERPLVEFQGEVLREAKVITFAVVPEHRNRGIGQALQREGMRRAKEMGCYQFRSRSGNFSLGKRPW